VKPAILNQGRGAVLYDGDRLSADEMATLLPVLLESGGEALPNLAGRGGVRLVRHGNQEWIWRQNRRGGFVGRLIAGRYLWLGRERTRVWREWRLLQTLHARGLPVPAPVAAVHSRHGLVYECGLLTERLPGVESLAARLNRAPLPDTTWTAIGRCLARFHAAGACHADLNAHNILFNDRDEVFLVDFDRGRLRRPGGWRARNRRRLHRSLVKITRDLPGEVFPPGAWRRLEAGALTGV
jgi:3-deoxy-D-manno-octulosonic acid kinase